MKILVVGAHFNNKGAQSMLFTTIDELKKSFEEGTVYYAGVDHFDESNYAFPMLFYSEFSKNIALKKFPVLDVLICTIKDLVKFTLGKRKNLWRFMELRRKMPYIDCIVDVSGYNLGDKWGEKVQISYLRNIELARKYNKPMFLMPQSFGPFEYSTELQYLHTQIKDLLSYPIKIFARESQGYELLVEKYCLKNVEKSADLVLQDRGIDSKNIFRKNRIINVPKVEPGSVGFVPNMQCAVHTTMHNAITIYREAIERVLLLGRKVYILRHSTADIEICRELKNVFIDNCNVELTNQDFDCIEYGEYIKRFEYIVGSRYHGIVHAYRESVPCIAIGWAVKYIELAESVGQIDFAFDITLPNFNTACLIDAITKLNSNVSLARTEISNNVTAIQKQSCFKYVTEWLMSNEMRKE